MFRLDSSTSISWCIVFHYKNNTRPRVVLAMLTLFRPSVFTGSAKDFWGGTIHQPPILQTLQFQNTFVYARSFKKIMGEWPTCKMNALYRSDWYQYVILSQKLLYFWKSHNSVNHIWYQKTTGAWTQLKRNKKAPTKSLNNSRYINVICRKRMFQNVPFKHLAVFFGHCILSIRC